MASALVVPVPAAEIVVGPWRSELDPSAALGVPAHVTVLSPFLAAERIDSDTIAALSAIYESFPGFSFQLGSTRWFGTEVLYLAPEPAEPFIRMTEALQVDWPDLHPYGKPGNDVVPHLTIGHGVSESRLAEAEIQVAPSLPIDCVAHEVRLMVGSTRPGSWTTRSTFRLRA